MSEMTPKRRLVTALDSGQPDRLPVTTHHVKKYFLNKYLGGMDYRAFSDAFGFDPTQTTVHLFDLTHRVVSDAWRSGNRVCMIGGFDQFHFFTGCTPEETRAEVRRCFEAACAGGGHILCPSNHFFDAEPALLRAFEAKRCRYG